MKKVDKAISEAIENRTGANYIRTTAENQAEGGKKKKKRKISSESEGGSEAQSSDNESSQSATAAKKKPAKKMKKVKIPKGPKRWDEVNLDADRRYFDVSDNIEAGSGTVVSLSDQEPAPLNPGSDQANNSSLMTDY